MKLVYPVGILAALSLASCSKSSDGPSTATTASAGSDPLAASISGPRRNTPLAIVPGTVQPLLPKHGIYAHGGGTATTPWRTIVDLDAGTVTAATSSSVGGLPFDKMEHTSTRPLTDAERTVFTGLSERAWREPMPTLSHPTGDYGEVLATTDGDDAFYLDGFGPMQPAAAAALVNKLKLIAGH